MSRIFLESGKMSCPGLYHMPRAADGCLCRIRLEQGRISPQQMQRLADLAQDYGNGIIELTSRANIQLRGIAPEKTQNLSTALEEAGLGPRMQAGDGVRNVMVSPTAGFDPRGDGRIPALASTLSERLQANPRSQTLSPKFSILLDGGEDCAIVHHVSDIWLCLCDDGKNFVFGLASRPPLAEENSKDGAMVNLANIANNGLTALPSIALGKIRFYEAEKLIFILIDCLLEARAQQPGVERMKHLLNHQTISMITDFISRKLLLLPGAENFRRVQPEAHAHLGIHQTRHEQRFYLGVKPPLGRLSPDFARMIADISAVMDMDVSSLRLTPWQSLLFTNITRQQGETLEQFFAATGFITDAKAALAHIVCCAGAPFCHAARSDVQTDALALARWLENRSVRPIHLTGCAKSCAVNQARGTTLVATENGLYDLFDADKADASSNFGQQVARSLTIEQAAHHLTHLPKINGHQKANGEAKRGVDCP